MKIDVRQRWLQLMQQGQQHYQRGKFDQAERFFGEATRAVPGQAEGWVNLAAAQAQQGRLNEAASSLQNALKLNPRLMPALMLLGDVLRLMGRFEEMVAAYRQAADLQRAPEILNKLASALRTRGKPEEAEALYREALQKEPGFNAARVNLATVQVELRNYDEARRQLEAQDLAVLNAEEREEALTTRLALEQFLQVQPVLERAFETEDFEPLYEVLSRQPEEMLGVDEEVLEGIRGYIRSAQRLEPDAGVETIPLPEDWPLVEALFMIPYVETVEAYLEVKEKLSNGVEPEGELLESLAMEPVVRACRDASEGLHDPVKVEMHLRHWHWLATRQLSEFVPGQFKVTRNLSGADLRKRRAQPHLAAGTLRAAFGEIYRELSPGILRGLVSFLAISDVHAFADGNGRLGLVLINRELEEVGQMPALFIREMGLTGRLGAALRETRSRGGDLGPLLPVIEEAQLFARQFCEELASVS